MGKYPNNAALKHLALFEILSGYFRILHHIFQNVNTSFADMTVPYSTAEYMDRLHRLTSLITTEETGLSVKNQLPDSLSISRPRTPGKFNSLEWLLLTPIHYRIHSSTSQRPSTTIYQPTTMYYNSPKLLSILTQSTVSKTYPALVLPKPPNPITSAISLCSTSITTFFANFCLLRFSRRAANFLASNSCRIFILS